MPAAKLTITIVVQDWTVEALRKAVADLDAVNDAVGIAEGNVQALDVVTLMVNGELGADFEVVESLMEDG